LPGVSQVDFPLDGLDVAPYMAEGMVEADAGTLYDCFGVVNHYGHASFGHYTASVRGGEWGDRAAAAPSTAAGAAARSPSGAGVLPGEWWKFDDSRVTRMSREDVVSQEAYVLFYRRRPPMPARLL